MKGARTPGSTARLVAGSRVLASFATAAWLIGAVVLVDPSFERRSSSCDLHRPETCLVDPGMVTESPIGLVAWRPGDDLVVELGALAPGDVLKLKLCDPEGPQAVDVAVDGVRIGTAHVDGSWRQTELVVPHAGRELRLQRRDRAGATLHLSRLSVANTVTHSTGVVEGYVVHRTGRPTVARDWVATCWVLVAIAGMIGLVAEWERRRAGSDWRSAVQEVAVATWPTAILAGGAAATSVLSPYRIVIAPHTVIGVVAVTLLVQRLLHHRLAVTAAASRSRAAVGVRLGRWAGRLGNDRRAFVVVAIGGLALLAAAALVLRPASPFEWDEVLFLRALDGYDVGRHSPHPPGYPLYVGAAWALTRLAIGPLQALQMVSVIGALVAIVATAGAMRRLGAGRGEALLGGAMLASLPAFAFHAAVGMSDALATGLAVVALWATAAVAEEPERPRHLVLLAVAAAGAAAVRPQTLALLLLPGAWALGRHVWGRRWRSAALAVVAGAAVSAACWLPAILLTGWPRYWRAIQVMREWIAVKERGYRLPGAPLDLVADAWLVRPFGSPAMALVFGALVLLGAVAWWRTGRRRLVLLAAPAAACYLLIGAFSLQLDTAVRYILPALPCLAMLAAGVVGLRPRPLARAAATAALALAIAEAAWLAPTLLRRAGEPAPLWAALTWVRDHAPPGTAVVFDVGAKPHALFLLGAGDLRLAEAGSARAEELRGEVWQVRLDPDPDLEGEVLFEARWPAEPLGRLARNRYLAAAVVRRTR